VIISDYRMPQFTGLAALKLMLGRGLDLPFILVSGAIGEDIAVEAMKAGAHDYLLKGSLARLAPAVERELRDAEARREHKRAVEALHESEARLAGIVGAAMDAIITTGADEHIILFNAAAEKMFCCAASEAIGSLIGRFIPERVRSCHTGHLQSFGQEGASSRAMGRIAAISGLRGNGEEFPIEASISRTESGGRKLFTVTLCDITERKRAEASLRLQADEIRTLNQELESRVIERTSELQTAVDSLQLEIAERQRLEREILEISEREKARVGQDLHDGLCQTLTGISLTARVLQRNLAEEKLPPANASAETERVVSMVKDAIGEARGLAMEMYPVTIEEHGLAHALEKLACSMAQRFQIKCKFKCAEPIELADNQVAAHVYRITQEAVSNAFKHGRAERVAIKLAAAGQRIILKIEDDGEGVVQELKPTGMGLKTMNYRARAIGGFLEIRQRPRRGLAVICSFPNQRPEA
jgi:PAS domain S-box-containing protein